ncbi:hypothetical protein LINPERHAP1_LOCUS39850 [Linum perenne]
MAAVSPLVHNFCKKTSSPSLCEVTLFSHQGTSRARDAFTLAYIAVRLSYLNATSTHNYINDLLKNPHGSGGEVGRQRLRVCESRYSLALGLVSSMDEDINDDTYSNLAYLARAAKAHVKGCEAAFVKATWQPMGNLNQVMEVLFEVIVAIGTSVAGPP